MPIDLAVLAATVVSSFLVPIAKQGLEKVGDSLTDLAGEAAASGASAVWARVKALFTSDRERMQFEELEQHPDDGAGTVKRVLEEKLRADPAAAGELAALVNQPVSGGGATLQHIMATNFGFVDARNAVIGGSAQVAGNIINAPAPLPAARDVSISVGGDNRRDRADSVIDPRSGGDGPGPYKR